MRLRSGCVIRVLEDQTPLLPRPIHHSLRERWAASLVDHSESEESSRRTQQEQSRSYERLENYAKEKAYINTSKETRKIGTARAGTGYSRGQSNETRVQPQVQINVAKERDQRSMDQLMYWNQADMLRPSNKRQRETMDSEDGQQGVRIKQEGEAPLAKRHKAPPQTQRLAATPDDSSAPPSSMFRSLPSKLEAFDTSQFHREEPGSQSQAANFHTLSGLNVPQRLVTIHSEADWAEQISRNDSPVTYLDLGPLFVLTDHIDELVHRGPRLTGNVMRLTAGNLELRLPISHECFVHLIKACPRLQFLSIHGAVNLHDKSFQTVLHRCLDIQHIALCGSDFEPNMISGTALRVLASNKNIALFLQKIALKNTAVHSEMVRNLRDARPTLLISASG
ncbi:hypothetical protein C8035_v001045 [Colletotrichum spinosum]|uniref:Uncharacterized protein n=1 Tax=Colletotrichum spinosum TaxID=1347390 RepID=A0A4R8Q1Y6_9PEZI|nr:hypothetical protein C8035_v001045 [Colletotrichum spinosum]